MVQSNHINKIEFPKIKTQFLAEIEFGMPSKECKNFGICRISPIRKEGIDKESKNLVMITLMEGGHLELTFFKSFLRPNAYEKFFSKGTFLIEEKYSFFSEESSDFNFQVDKGLHPIQERASTVSILFKTQQQV